MNSAQSMTSLVNDLPVLTTLMNIPLISNQNVFSECSTQKNKAKPEYISYNIIYCIPAKK